MFHLNNGLRLFFLFVIIADPVINCSSSVLRPVSVTHQYLSNEAVSVFLVTKISIPLSPDRLWQRNPDPPIAKYRNQFCWFFAEGPDLGDFLLDLQIGRFCTVYLHGICVSLSLIWMIYYICWYHGHQWQLTTYLIVYLAIYMHLKKRHEVWIIITSQPSMKFDKCCAKGHACVV